MASCVDAIVRWQPVIDGVNMKSRIIEQLGQTHILVPPLIAEGLAANDRVKVRMSAPQAPAKRAHNIDSTPFDPTVECRAAFDSESVDRPAAGPDPVILCIPTPAPPTSLASRLPPASRRRLAAAPPMPPWWRDNWGSLVS
jgi:hypothetical protein